MSVDFQDTTGEPEDAESIRQALEVVQQQMITNMTNLPPELAVHMGVISRVLKEALEIKEWESKRGRDE